MFCNDIQTFCNFLLFSPSAARLQRLSIVFNNFCINVHRCRIIASK